MKNKVVLVVSKILGDFKSTAVTFFWNRKRKSRYNENQALEECDAFLNRSLTQEQQLSFYRVIFIFFIANKSCISPYTLSWSKISWYFLVPAMPLVGRIFIVLKTSRNIKFSCFFWNITSKPIYFEFYFFVTFCLIISIVNL